jgi:hypothetical protein
LCTIGVGSCRCQAIKAVEQDNAAAKAAKAAREKELAAVKVDAADTATLAAELEVLALDPFRNRASLPQLLDSRIDTCILYANSRLQIAPRDAERLLRESGGDIAATLRAFVNK